MSDLKFFRSYFGIRNIAINELMAMIVAAEKFYRSFLLPKKKGGDRKIDVPYPLLLDVQRKIYKTLISSIDYHDSSCAYIPGKDIATHAGRHVKNDELLIMDITDFFGSISENMVKSALFESGIDSELISNIVALCCLNGSLPQGAPTSPMLSNLVLHQFDRRANALARRYSLVYSRYADDLAFSGNKIPYKFQEFVTSIINEEGFSINYEKTRFSRKGQKKIITGISITNKKLRVPKRYKRELRAAIHNIEKNEEDLAQLKPLDPMLIERTLGKINYVVKIEPDNSFYKEKKVALSSIYDRVFR